jgi:uncharacterized protein (TIGR03790 family)
MIRYLSRLLCLTLFAAAFLPSDAQGRKDYNLETDYGVWYMNGKLQVKNMVAGADTNAAKAKFPKLAEYLRVRKAPIAKLMNMNVLPAAWNDAVLQGQSEDIAGIITSRNGIDAPDGDYDVNYPCFVSMGDYRGKGTGYTNPTPSTGGRNMNTCLRFTGKANWIGTEFDVINLMQASTWGVLSGASSYIESGTISGFRFEGDNSGWYNPTYTSNGLGMWDMGETWTVDHIFATNFNGYGIANVRGTPAKYSTISLFTNALGGIALIGTQLNNIWIEGISGDDNPALIVQVDGYGRGAGGNLTVTGEKSESGKRSPNKGQILLWQRSPCVGNVTVLSPQADMNGNFTDASFVMNSREWGQTLNVLGYVAWNCRTLVHDVTNKKRWAVASYSPQSFVWASRNGGTLTDLVAMQQVPGMPVNANDRLGMVANNGQFDYVNGSPTYSITGGTVTPPTCTATWVPGTQNCGQCTGGVITCTTPWVSSGDCTPVVSKPVDVVSTTSCPVTPPTPVASVIDPGDVAILVNTSDAASAAMATAYASAWGIPASNIVSVNLGGSDNVSTTSLITSARSALATAGKQYTVLAFSKPSRFGSQSITSAITFGPRTVSDLTISPLYTYIGNKPFSTHGVRPSMMLVDAKYIRRDAHGTKPTGSAYMVLAKDSNGSPRGAARASQTATGLKVFDNRTLSNVGSGENACNNLGDDCWIASRKPTGAVIAYYGSMYKLCCDAGVTWRKGFYGDHVTSFGGYLPALSTGINSNGQTPLTWHLDRGAAASCGTVSEPWQGGSGSLAQQFVNASMFHPLFIGGQPMGIACWASIQSPDRTLIAGDLMCAPFR